MHGYSNNVPPRTDYTPYQQTSWHCAANRRRYFAHEPATMRWPWEGPPGPAPHKLHFSNDIYNEAPQATAQGLSRSMGIYIRDDATRAQLVESKYDATRHPPMAVFMRQCLDMVWIADDFQGKAKRTLPLPHLSEAQRTACLAFMWAVQHDKTIEQGETALEAARHVGWDELLKVLGLEIGNATMASAAMGACGYASYTVGAASAGAASKAWAVGTLAGKAKAGAFLLAGGIGMTVAASIGLAAAGYAWRNHKGLETWRHETNATQAGRDALFCEIVTHRRYRRKMVQP